MKIFKTVHGNTSTERLLSSISIAYERNLDIASWGITFEDIPTVILVTNAPSNYDGFGTTTIAENDGWRLVETFPEHTVWQQNRYWSGLYQGIRLDEEPKTD